MPEPISAEAHAAHEEPHPAREMHPVGTLPALQSLLHIIVVALFLMTFTVQPFRIPSESMEPTLLVGDFLLVDKQEVSQGSGLILPAAGIHRGDVIVFHDPVDPAIHLVKRVIGLPGERVHLHGNRVYIDGKPLDESYAVYRRSPPDSFRDDFPHMQTADPAVDAAWWVQLRGLVHDGEITVPASEYFVLGDNRNDSEDSRYWGFVPRGNIVGKPVVVYFSIREREAGTGWLNFARWGRTLHIVR